MVLPESPTALTIAAADSATGDRRGQQRIRVLVFAEATTIAGAVKPVLEFAREAATSTQPAIELAMVVFHRVGQSSGLLDVLRARGIPVEEVSERRAFDFSVIAQIRAIVEKWRPDLIWTNNTKSHFLVRLSTSREKTAWTAFHHGYTTEARRTRIYNQLDRWSLGAADRVVTVCNDFAEQLRRKGVPAGRIVVERNPVRVDAPVGEPEKARLRRELGISGSDRVLLTVGRLSHEKGHADLLRALAELRAQVSPVRLRLIIVGDGPERERLETLRSEFALQDIVHFAGYQPEVQPYYAISNIFVLPSHSEGSPNVLLEAIAADLPIVATAVGGVPEVLSNEVNALLVPRQDVKQLVHALKRIVDDPPLGRRLLRESKNVLAQHDPKTYFRNIVGIFEKVIGEHSAR